MKRLNHLYEKVYSLENLYLAEAKARKGKQWQYGVKVFDRDKEGNLLKLHHMLKDKTYRTSPYTVFSVYEPKEREVYRLPYFPDRIAHHAVMNVLEYIFVSRFTADTYSCIKKRGIHAAANKLRKALKDVEGTAYCLKIDIKKFYPSVDHDILKYQLRHEFKDRDLLWFLDEIIDSAPGLPIGNYLSQYLANFYLTFFDHWIKEKRMVKNYFRYADDIVILHGSKAYLHQLLADIRLYLERNLKLQVKDNYQVFPVESRGIDFLGYVFRHSHVRLRKTIKKNFARKLKDRSFKGNRRATIASYLGWMKHCNATHLHKKLLLHEKV